MLALRTSEIRDKYTGEVIGEVQEDTRRDLRAKIHRAFLAKGAVRRTSFEERAELGRRIAKRLGERRAELEELMVREGGQPRKFARWEMDRAIASAANLERRLELLKPRELPAASGRNFLTREPYGVVGVLPPRNTPLVVPLYTMLCALGAGNAVVEKPSSLVPLICQRLVQIVVEAGCPTDSVQFSTCPGEDAAWEFIENPEVDVLVHYASSPVGKDNLIKMGSYLARTKKTLGECMLHVGGRMKKYVPELAGNDPFIVLESADLTQAAAAGLLGGFAHSGQLCIAAKRFLVQRSIASDFRERLVEGIRRLKVGDPRDEETDIGPIGKHESLDIATYQVREALERGGRLLDRGPGRRPVLHPHADRVREGADPGEERGGEALSLDRGGLCSRSFLRGLRHFRRGGRSGQRRPLRARRERLRRAGGGVGRRPGPRGREGHDQRRAALQRPLAADRRDPRQRTERLDRQARGDGLHQEDPSRDVKPSSDLARPLGALQQFLRTEAASGVLLLAAAVLALVLANSGLRETYTHAIHLPLKFDVGAAGHRHDASFTPSTTGSWRSSSSSWGSRSSASS